MPNEVGFTIDIDVTPDASRELKEIEQRVRQLSGEFRKASLESTQAQRAEFIGRQRNIKQALTGVMDVRRQRSEASQEVRRHARREREEITSTAMARRRRFQEFEKQRVSAHSEELGRIRTEGNLRSRFANTQLRHIQQVSREQRRAQRSVSLGGRSDTLFSSRGLQTFTQRLRDARVAVAGFGLALSGIGSYVISASAEFDRINRGLIAITGNASRARAQLSQIQELSRLPGVTFQGAARSALRLRASGFDLDTTGRIIEEFGNVGQASGATTADVNEAIRQLTQIVATQKFTAENLNVILERLPAFRGIFQRQFGTAVGGRVQAAAEARGLSTREVVDLILAESARIARVSADSFDNSVSNLQNDLNALAREIGDRLLPVAKGIVDGLAGLTRFLATDFGQTLLTLGTGALVGRGIQAGIRGILGGRLGGSLIAGGLVGSATSGIGASGINVNQSLARNLTRGTSSSARNSTTQFLNFVAGTPTGDAQAANERISAAQRAGRRAGSRLGRFGTGFRSFVGTFGGLALGASAAFAFDQYSQYQERVAANTALIADELESIRSNFNDRVFGGDKGLGQLKTFDESLIAVHKDLGAILGLTDGNRFSGNFDRIRRELTTGTAETAEALRGQLFQFSDDLEFHFRIATQVARGRLLQLNPADLTVAQLRSFTPRLQALFTASDAQLASDVARQQRLQTEQASTVARITQLRNQIEASTPTTVASGLGRTTREVFPEIAGVSNVREYRKERERLLATAIEERNEREVNLTNLATEIERQKQYNAELRKASDILKELRRLTGEADPENRLIRARTQLERAGFDERTITSPEASLEVRNRIQSANAAIRDASIEAAQLREQARKEAERDEVRLQATIAQIRQRARIADETAEQEHQDRLTRIRERRERERRDIERRQQEFRNEQEAQRRAVETANEAINILSSSVSSLGNTLRRFGNTASEVWNTFTFQTEAAGRALQDVVIQSEVAQTVANFAGVRSGLTRDPRANDEIRRLYRNLRQGHRITAAVQSILASPTLQPEPLRPLPDLRPQQAQRTRASQQIQGFLQAQGSTAYNQFGAAFLLNVLGLSSRSQDAVNDALDDVRENFRQLQVDISRDETLSAQQRAESLREINLQYITERREIERRAEQERSRAWRDYYKTLIVNFGNLIVQQLQYRAAIRATNALLDNVPALQRFFGGGSGFSGGTAVAGAPSAFGAVQGAAQSGALSTGATAAVNVGIAATTVAGLIDPIRDVFASFGFHNAANDEYARKAGIAAGKKLFAGQSPQAYGMQSARDLVDNIQQGLIEGGAGGGGEMVVETTVNLNLQDSTIQKIVTRENVLARQGRLPPRR